MNYADEIKKSIDSGGNSRDIARKVYLLYQAHAFIDREEMEYDIKNSIKENLNVPFTSIQIVGSAKTGFSVFRSTSFTERKSDLDVSIISNELYNELVEISHKETNGYCDLRAFEQYKGRDTHVQFKNGLEKGFLNPFYMPNCKRKTEWLSYFRNLSSNYYKVFKNINAGVYSSEYFFEYKQSECIDKFRESKDSYDSLPSKV